MTPPGSVGGDARLRLFLALELPPGTRDILVSWAAAHLAGGRVASREQLHVTLAFLGSRPAHEVGAIVGALRDAVAEGTGRIVFEPARWRETRTAGMLVLADHGRVAGQLAGRLHDALRALGLPFASGARGCHTSPCSGSAGALASTRRSPRREHSFRPTRLLSCLDCTRPEPGTRCWNASR